MPLGFHFRLVLVYLALLAFVEGQHFAGTPTIARSMKPINEDKTATEEQKNMDNLRNVYSSSQHRSVPLVNYSEGAASKNVSASTSADSFWRGRPLSRRITSPTSSKRALNFVYPYPVSGGTTSSRSAKWMMRVNNSSYTPQRFGPVEGGHSVGPNYLNQDQYKRHVTGLNLLPGNQTDGGSQHSGRILALSKNTIQVNERGSIVRGTWYRIKPSESPSSPLVEKVTGVSRKLSLLQPRPLLQDPLKPNINANILSNVQTTNGAHSVALKPNQEDQVQTDRGTTQQDQATNSKPVNLVRVKPGHTSEVLHLFGNTNTNIYNQDTKIQDKFQDVHRTSKSDPVVTHLPISSSATSRGVFYHPRFTSTDSSVVQSQTTLELSQSKPNSASAASQIEGSTVSTSSASQPGWKYTSQPNVEKLDVLQNAQKAGRVQWLVVKPYTASNSARKTGYKTSNSPSSLNLNDMDKESTYHTHYKIKVIANLNLKKSFEVPAQKNISLFFRPKTLHDLQVKEHSETNAKQTVTFSRFRLNTEVPSINGSAVLNSGSDQSIKNYLSRNSSEIFKSIATDATMPSSPISISAVNFSSPENATGGGQTLAGNVYSVHVSTGHNKALSYRSKPQAATEDKNMSVSDSISASLESITPQNGIRLIQAKMITGLPSPKEAHQINSTKEHQQENEDQTKTVEQLSSHINATQSSRPTSTVVVVTKHVYRKNKSTESLNSYENSQPPIYRSAIIRRKSTNRLLANVSNDISKDAIKPENHGMVNQSAEIKVQTESSTAETELYPSYSDLKSTNISVNTNSVQSINSQQSLNSSQSKFKQTKPLSIKYLDIVGSAAISIHKPVRAGQMINGTERHISSDSLPTSTLVPTTAEPISATAKDDVTKATDLLGDGIEPTASVVPPFL